MLTWLKNLFGFKSKSDQKIQEPATKMPIEDFVGESIIGIFNGIRIAQKEITRIPFGTDSDKYLVPYIMPTPVGGREYQISQIDFDIAVTVDCATISSQKANGKASVFVISADLELEKSESKTIQTSSVSRMKFSVPVIYPQMFLPHPGNEQ